MCFRPSEIKMPKKCPQCGKTWDDEETICPDCGVDLPTGPALPSVGAPGAPSAPERPAAPGAPGSPSTPAAPGAPRKRI